MANEQPGNEDAVTPKGAVEVDENELDQAAGGFSIAYSKIEMNYKPAPQPTASPDLSTGGEPDKKL